MIKFEVKNRFSGNVQFTAEIDCDESQPRSWKLRLAVLWAIRNGADLRGAYLRGANLMDAYLGGADLRDANLMDAYLMDANLMDAYLGGADLRDANLMDAKFGDAPVIPNIHTAVYEAATSTPDALNMGDWHTCETTHCRAGWVTTLAGEEGKKLEGNLGHAAAALAIYAASDPEYFTRDGIPDFYCDNEAALADMKRLADMEAAT